jgi:hypothetical protein
MKFMLDHTLMKNQHVGYELRREAEGKIPIVEIITHGGEITGVDADNHPKIQNATPKDYMYDPLKQKMCFKYAIEIFRGVSAPKMVENPPKVILQP